MDTKFLRSLNADELRILCRQNQIPLNGAKNKKELLGRFFERRQMFKPTLPYEVYKSIFIYCFYHDLLNLRLCNKLFYRIIDDKFWQEKIKIEFNRNGCSRLKYVELATQRGDILIGSEFFITREECLFKVQTEYKFLENKKLLINYFENCKEQ